MTRISLDTVDVANSCIMPQEGVESIAQSEVSASDAPVSNKSKKGPNQELDFSLPLVLMLFVIIGGGAFLLFDEPQAPQRIIQERVIIQDQNGRVVSSEPSSESEDAPVSEESLESSSSEEIGTLVKTAAAGAAAKATGFMDKLAQQAKELKQGIVQAVKPTVLAPTLSEDINKWLGFLQSSETFVVEQKRRGQECIEACLGCEIANQYFVKRESYSRQQDGEVKNDGDWEDKHPDQVMLTAIEDSNCCMRQVCGRLATFTLDIYPKYHKKDMGGTPILKIERPFSCTDAAGIIPFFNACGMGQTMKILDPMSGKVIGTVKEICGTTCWKGTWEVYRNDRDKEELIATVNSPIMPQAYMCCCEDIDFPVFRAKTEEQIGKISRRWGDWCTSMCSTYDDMSVTVTDQKVDLVERILLMSTALLFKYVYFESSPADVVDNAMCMADVACCVCGPEGCIHDPSDACDAVCCLAECLLGSN